MRMQKSILIVLLLLISVGQADAKWWIFGQNKEEVTTRYLYLNDVSYDELGEKVTLYKETLPQGKVVLRGQGSAASSKVGAVQISTDQKQTWQKATLTTNGSFVFEFESERDQVYDLYVKILDTTGKSNDVDATHKEITIAEGDIRAQVDAILQSLVEAYKGEDSFAFMRQVSDNFVGGTSILDSAVRKDFNYFDNLDLYYTLNNVTSAPQGKLFVSLSFSRSVTSSRSGVTYSDKGETEFVLMNENGTLKISSMKNPLLFGLSDAANVATGSVNTGSNDPILVVDSSGNLETMPYRDALATIDGTASTAALSGTFTLIWRSDGTDRDSFVFSSQSVTDWYSTWGDLHDEINLIFLNNGAAGYEIGTVSLSTVDSVSSVGADYTLSSLGADTNIGKVFGLRLGSGKYAAIRIVSHAFIDTATNPPNTRVVIEYKYQPDGSSNF